MKKVEIGDLVWVSRPPKLGVVVDIRHSTLHRTPPLADVWIINYGAPHSFLLSQCVVLDIE